MKAHAPKVYTTEKQIKEQVKKDYEMMYQRHQENIQKDIVVQLLGTVLFTLDKSYGWRKRRLKKFIRELDGIFDLMNCLPFDTVDNATYIYEKYGIDLKKEVTVNG